MKAIIWSLAAAFFEWPDNSTRIPTATPYPAEQATLKPSERPP